MAETDQPPVSQPAADDSQIEKAKPQPESAVMPPGVQAIPPQMIAAIQASLQIHAGPLPPPQALAEYNRIVPGSAKQIFDMVESQSKHRMDLEKTVVQNGNANERIGIFAGLILALACLAFAAYALRLGHNLSSVAVVLGLMAGIAGCFLSARNSGRTELKNRLQANRPPAPSAQRIPGNP